MTDKGNKKNDGMQKGKRRQNLKEKQNNRGDSNIPSGYKTFSGNEIE